MNGTLLIIIGTVILTALWLAYSLRSENPRNKNTNPLAEAEVYLAYGRKKQAIEILERYLLTNPDDETAITLLTKAKE